VTASDLNGLPNAGGLYPSGVSVTLDVDTNNDGNFTDPGEAGYATGTLVNGSATITLPPLPGPGTYPVRASLYDLAGNLISQTNRNGLRIDRGYDAEGRVTSEIWYAADGTSIVQSALYQYDDAGNLVSASNANGAYIFTYTAAGQVASVSEPFGVSLRFTYDEAGNRIAVADSFGGLEQSVYDGANRLVQRTYSAPGQPSLRMDFTHDADGNLLHEARYADLAGTQKVGFSSYNYDNAANVLHIQHQNGTGAVLAFHLLDDALALLAEMATFDEAGVSERLIETRDLPGAPGQV